MNEGTEVTTIGGTQMVSIDNNESLSSRASVNHEYETQVAEPGDVHVYKRRWYILLVFCMLGMVQDAVWNTWGPLAVSAQLAYDWDLDHIALLPTWGPGMYLLGFVPIVLLTDRIGFRYSILFGVILITAGSSFRLIKSHVTIFFNLCAALNGLAGPIIMCLATSVSAVWFPAHERTTATAISTSSGSVGVAVSFLAGSLLVNNVANNSNTTDSNGSLEENSSNAEIIRDKIYIILVTEFAISCALLVAILFYFPSRPPHHPSVSATKTRYSIKSSICSLCSNRNFWLICLSYVFTNGIYAAFTNLFVINLQFYGVNEIEANWIGFYSTVAGISAGLIFAKLSDMMQQNMKHTLVLLYLTTAISFLWFTFMCEKVIPVNRASLYLSNIIGSAALYGSIPLSYEFACEVSFPIDEMVPSTMLGLLKNLLTLVMLLITMTIRQTDATWINFVLVSSCMLSILLTALLKPSYTRLMIDLETDGAKQ